MGEFKAFKNLIDLVIICIFYPMLCIIVITDSALDVDFLGLGGAF